MLKRMILGDMQTNCYILSCDEKNCIVIDPGANGQKVSRFLDENQYHLSAILLTHGHFDHIGAVDYLYDKYHCDIYAHSDTIEMCRDEKINLSIYNQSMVIHAPIISVSDEIDIASYHIKWLLLEGHCQGSSMIYIEKEHWLFSGDVLFAQSIGRYDFPTSSHLQTKKTLETISKFEFDARVFPGHGEETLLSYEQQNNPYLISF